MERASANSRVGVRFHTPMPEEWFWDVVVVVLCCVLCVVLYCHFAFCAKGSLSPSRGKEIDKVNKPSTPQVAVVPVDFETSSPLTGPSQFSLSVVGAGVTCVSECANGVGLNVFLFSESSILFTFVCVCV